MKSRPEKGNAPEVAATEASNVKTQLLTEGSNMSDSKALTIGTTRVRQVGELYSLNDLHKASGGEALKRPGEFMRNQQAQDLVAEISNAGIPAFESRKGNKGGTYACKELVIAYAAWISAAFHLKVIRVFLAQTAPSQKVGNPAISYDRISPAQAQDLKEIVEAIVKAGVQGFGETWNRLHRKFKVNSYLQLPAARHLEARKYLIAKLPAGYAGEVVNEEPELPRLHLHLIPPPVGSSHYNPANPHPVNGRTIEVAKSIAADIRDWSNSLPACPARGDLRDAAQTLYDLLVTGWSNVDEALCQLHTAMNYLNRWQGRGGYIGNLG